MTAGSLSARPGMKQQTYLAMAFQTRCARNGRGMPDEVTPALTGATCGGHADTRPHIFGPAVGVRRLTPRECERLQGFPDDYTLVPNYRRPLRAKSPDETAELATYLGIPLTEAMELGATPDGARYRALGNSMAVPVMRWIGRRIAVVHSLLERKSGA